MVEDSSYFGASSNASHVRADAADWKAWLGLAGWGRCEPIYCGRSLFSLTAAAASGASEVYVARERVMRTFEPSEECDVAFELIAAAAAKKHGQTGQHARGQPAAGRRHHSPASRHAQWHAVHLGFP